MVGGEGADVWYQRLWRALEPEHYQAITAEAERFLLPMLRFSRS
ncbi:recC [Pluralibacter gergoviae]|nr:recC [Pluralibacter gergoviae]